MTTAQVATREEKPSLLFRPVIAQAHAVEKSYGTIQALCGVNLNLQAGEILALLGPNGAGKTTLIRLLLGLAKPSRGAIRLFGEDPQQQSCRIRIGAMLQTGRVPETMRVSEHIDLFSCYYPNPLPLQEVLSIAGLQGIERRLFGELSGGQKQRVLFALAICGNPDIIFLDEPTVGLDVESRRNLWQQIRKLAAQGKTVLLTTHYLEEAEALANRIAVIHQGKIVAEGTPQEIKAKAGGKRIRCISSLPPAVVSSFPGVVAVNRHHEALEIQTAAAEDTLRALLLHDPMLSELEVNNAGIEEAFLSLTQTDIQQGKTV